MTALTLSNPGLRTDRMDADRATALVNHWKERLTATPNSYIGTVDLQGRVYDPESVPILVKFLNDKLSDCTVVLLNDIIASLPTEKGLQVLGGFASLFITAPVAELNVSDNAIGQQGLALETLQSLLKCKSLERLYMENDGLDECCMSQLADILTLEDDEEHCVCDQLTLIHFYNNMSGIGGAKAAGRIIARCRILESFRYEGNRPQPVGCQFIANGLLECSQFCDTLKSIRLEGSYGNDEDLDPIGALLKALERFTQLSHVTLYDAALESKGTKLLCTALQNHKLQSFEVPQNEVTRVTVGKAIVELVKRNLTTLKTLNLSSNELTSVGVERLMEAFAEGNAALEILKLGENNIGTRGAIALMSHADNLPFLKELHLDENGFPDEVMEKLHEAFGDKLVEMEANDDEDKDDDNDDQEDEEDDDDNDFLESENGIEDLTQRFYSQAM